jgi:hypothetical protein
MKKAAQFLKGFKKGFLDFGYNIILLVNSVFLLFIYFVGVGLTSIIAKLSRKKFLNAVVDKKRKTYWTEPDLKNKLIDDFYRQF